MLRIRSSLRWLSVLLALGFLAAGCGEDVNEPAVTEDDDVNLEDPLGGYEATDEPELENDPYLTEMVIADALAGDPMADDPVIQEAIRDTVNHDLYVVRMAWGILPQSEATGVPEPQEEVDWTGSLTVTEGNILALRTIFFEPRLGDGIVRPRTSRDTLEFVSKTYEYFDGLLFIVAIPAAENDGTEQLSFNTGPFTHSWSFAELDSLNELHESNVEGRDVSIISFKRVPGACERGFVMGRWSDSPRNELGMFRGVWMNYSGRARGFLRGHYGVRGGEHLMFGKYFERGGDFRGFIRGTYSHIGLNFGRFHAFWLDPSEVEVGAMRGHWTSIPRSRRGFFMGHWSVNCMEDDG
ncbi:MAG: hypothetical protein GF355_16300 [Candidatus Eisenbacteria bacterium]|nr:hypothetical protein [Candidatus Eisenbacteria bacterium]